MFKGLATIIASIILVYSGFTELQLRKIPHFLPSNHLVIFTVDSKGQTRIKIIYFYLFLKNPQYASVYKFNAKLKTSVLKGEVPDNGSEINLHKNPSDQLLFEMG